MVLSAAELARAATEAFQDLEGFEATQTIQAGPIQATARVRFRKPDLCSVEYSSYRSPFLDLEEQLSHGAEFVPDEIVGMSFAYNGHHTMLVDAKHSVCLFKPRRHVAEPLPGFQAIAELTFLETLTHDFLVRDPARSEGDAPTRVLGVKPKTPYRPQLLRAVSYPIRRAVLTFDEKTLFPTHIEFVPDRGTILASLIRSSDGVVLSYADVRTSPPDPSAFQLAPPSGARVFREENLPHGSLPERLPFSLPIDPLTERGFARVEDACAVSLDEERARGYATVVLLRETDSGEETLVTLRVGNYLSRVMARRRARIAEGGREVQAESWEGRILDRLSSLPSRGPEAPERRTMFDVSWVRNDVFSILSADGAGEEELIEIAAAVAAAAQAGE
jgi:hypothetical protein